jgi:tetratricopeptide (TPR) repeat protein
MQRYRVNFPLLIGLVVAFVTAAPASYGLWKFQVNRNATRLLEEADAAEKSGDAKATYEALRQYTRLRNEDLEALDRLGHAAVKVSELEDIEIELRSEAYFALIDAVQRTEEQDGSEKQEANAKLRRELVDLHMAYGYFDRALESMQVLIDEGKADSELMALKVQCLFLSQDTGKATQWGYEVIGYNPQTRQFDKPGRAVDQPRVYGMLAQYLVSSKQDENAQKILDQLITANPESREAYMIRYRLLSSMRKQDEARKSLAKAFELEPDDADVLLAKGVEGLADYEKTLREADDSGEGSRADELKKQAEAELDAAAGFFSKGLEKFPDRIEFYIYAARIDMNRKKYDEALAIIERGLDRKEFELKSKKNALDIPIALDLANLKIDLLFAQEKVDEVRAVIKEFRDLRNDRMLPVADFHEAKIELLNENWAEAARRFGAVKNHLAGLPTMQALAGISKAQSHLNLMQLDLAADEYDWVLERFPDFVVAKRGKAEVDRRRGTSPEGDRIADLDERVNEMLQRPVDQQNWPALEALMDKFIADQAALSGAAETWILARQKLLRAQMYVTRATKTTDKSEQSTLFKQARDFVREAIALSPDDVTVQLAVPRVLMLEPNNGPANALVKLDELIAKNERSGIKETPPFRLLRIDLLFALNDEDVVNQIHAATTNMGDWTTGQQASIWTAAAGRFQQLGRLQDATLCLQEAAKLAPGALPIRMDLFELARGQADDAGMQAAQEEILKIVKDKKEPDYVLTEVKRMMTNYGASLITVDQLKPARTMLADAISRRPSWPELYILSGQLALVLEKDRPLALRELRKALEFGPSNLQALNLQVRLLADMGQYAEAREMMKRIPEASWTQMLERTAATVLGEVGEKDRAYAEAVKVRDSKLTDAATQVWFSDFASAAGKPAEAEAALQEAVKLAPTNPDIWSSLLTFYMQAQRADALTLALRRADLALDEEYLPLLSAHQYRMFGRFNEAEAIYLAAYRDTLNELPIAQRMAEFYLTWAEADAANRARQMGPNAMPEPGGTQAIRDKAVPLINKILLAANEGKAPHSDPTVSWARRQAARLFSVSGDYQDSLKAEKLLAFAVAAGAATPDGQELLIDILNRRGDPASRERTIALLQQIAKERPLKPHYELQLGQALADVGRWSEAERQLQNAIGRYPDDVALRVGLIEKLIERKDKARADSWLRRLEDVEGGDRAVPMLRIRLAAATGNKAELRKLLVQMTPNVAGNLTADQLAIIHSVALLAKEAGDTEYALDLIKQYSARSAAAGGNRAELAYYTAMYGDLEAGMNELKSLFDQDIDQLLGTAIEVYRSRRAENPEFLDAEVNRLVARALDDDPEAARRMVLQAESLEIQQKFDEAVAAYRKLLARDDVPKFVRATAQNNLSFLLAMTNRDLDQALAGVNEAAQIIGPISDVLDTRGLVYLRRNEIPQAVEDFQAAVKVNATASKYFHLAEALLAANDPDGALAAWKQAQDRGLSIDKVPEVERSDFEKTLQKINALQGKTEARYLPTFPGGPAASSDNWWTAA